MLRNQSLAAVSVTEIIRYFVYVRTKMIFVTPIARKYTVVKNICTCTKTKLTEECINSLVYIMHCADSGQCIIQTHKRTERYMQP